MRVKSSGIGPGVGKCLAPGQCNICKCPTPGTDKVGKCPAVARGGWAQVELTDALITRVRLIEVGNNRNDNFRYFLVVRVRLIEVSA